MLNLHLLECTVKGYDHISDLLLAKYWVITGCKYYSCKDLTSVTIDNSVESIGDYAFSYCKGLASVIIGNSVESIGGFAFDGCSKLLEVYCYAEKVPTASSYPYPHYIFAYAFDTSFIKNSILRVPAASIDSYKASEPWKHFGQIVALTEW